MSQQNVARLTWNKTILLVTSVFLVSTLATSLLQSRSLYLAPPLTNGTSIFYLILVSAPATLTLILCARKRPSGFRLTGILLLIWLGVLLCVNLALAGPALFRYSAIDCRSVTRSGWLVQHACTCHRKTPEGAAHREQADCLLEGFAFSPLLQLTEQGKWQTLP